MIKKTITYTDYNGTERTEDFWFNLTERELIKLEASQTGGLTARLNKLIQSSDYKTILDTMEEIILMAYGEPSPDGRGFIKVDENGRRLADSFKQTEAYETIFMEVGFNDVAAAEFIKGCIPKKLSTKLDDSKLENN